jgi:hypothetical protein
MMYAGPAEQVLPKARRSPPSQQHHSRQHGSNMGHQSKSRNNSQQYAVAPLPPQEKSMKKRIFTPVGTPVLKAFLDEDLAIFKVC